MQPGQDWERVIIRPKKPAAKTSTPNSSDTVTSKKFAAGSNANKGGGSMAKLDAETEQLSHKKVGLTLGKAIQQGRAAKGLTQAKLAQAINEKPVVINQYESGKAIPNGQIIAKIERALGTKLPRPKK